MNKLKIPENHSGVSKTLRLPENIVEDVQNLADLKKLSFNRTIISLLEFSLENLDDTDKAALQQNIDNVSWPIELYSLLLKFEVNRKILSKFGREESA